MSPRSGKPLSRGLRLLAWAACCAYVGCSLAGSHPPGSAADWPAYGGHVTGDRYSTLTQITPANVGKLREVWRFETHETGESQTNPLVIHGTVYAYTPGLKVVALDGATGRLRWKFDAGLKGAPMGAGKTFTGPSRGLAYWAGGEHPRLFAGIMNYLYALDPATGLPISEFGEGGAIDLRKDLAGDFRNHYVSLTSPGMIYKNLIIVGFRTSEAAPAPPGDIRAYDVRTGRLVWSFHTIPRPGEAGIETWPPDAWMHAGSANNWAGFALDAQRAIVYVPTGSAVSDFYGADRLGDDLYANSLIALDANTGHRIWHFQGVHHDLWDRDFPSPPSLVTVRRAGKAVDAIAQPTKQGYIYLFDRASGAPLFPIEEVPYPPSDVPGEVASPTQPRPTAPEPIARQRLTEDLLTHRTPEAHAWAVEQFHTFRSEGQFVPFTVGKQTVVFPGFDGGAEWGGSAVDPRRGIIYVNANDVAWTGSLVATTTGGGLGASLYQAQCSVCHGPDRSGSPPAFPSLQGIAERLSADAIAAVIHDGRGRMPPFQNIQGSALAGLVAYVQTGKDAAAPPPAATDTPAGVGRGANAKQEMSVTIFAEGAPARYRFTGYNKFLDPEGYPAVLPPWGTLNAIDLNTGKFLWKVPLGQYPELVARGQPDTGSENYGGPIVTRSGLLFIGATIYDRKFRAFDSQNGKLLWETELPFAGTATPATYSVGGRQFVVISTSNARNPGAPQGGAYVAFALPD